MNVLEKVTSFNSIPTKLTRERGSDMIRIVVGEGDLIVTAFSFGPGVGREKREEQVQSLPAHRTYTFDMVKRLGEILTATAEAMKEAHLIGMEYDEKKAKQMRGRPLCPRCKNHPNVKHFCEATRSNVGKA